MQSLETASPPDTGLWRHPYYRSSMLNDQRYYRSDGVLEQVWITARSARRTCAISFKVDPGGGRGLCISKAIRESDLPSMGASGPGRADLPARGKKTSGGFGARSGTR